MEAAGVVIEASAVRAVTAVAASEDFFFLAQDVLMRLVAFSKHPPTLQSMSTFLSSYKMIVSV